MVDGVGQAEIRGIDINRFVTGFADEDSLLMGLVSVSKTTAREIRWYQKTAGFLDSVDTTGITASKIFNVPERALPTIIGPTWTRNTSYVKKFMVESETIAEEDILDSDTQPFATTLRDLVRAVANQVDIRIYSTLIEAAAGTPTTPAPVDTLTTTATGGGWDDVVAGDPVVDILTGNQKIRSQSYDTTGIVLYINPIEHRLLVTHLSTVKGSSWPGFSEQAILKGQIMAILGNRVIVSQNATTNNALQFIPKRSAEWKTFTPLTSAVIMDPGIGKKIRVWARGEGLLTNPKSVHQITATVS